MSLIEIVFTLISVESMQMDSFGYVIHVAIIFLKAIDLMKPKWITIGSAQFQRNWKI